MNRKVRDQLGRHLEYNHPPERIVSLVPSQTELLFDLNLSDRIVGRTKFCIQPEGKVEDVMEVGGTKTLRLSDIRKLKPDLIIANKEENRKEQVEELSEDFPVWVSDVADMEQALEMIRRTGDLCDRHADADVMSMEIEELSRQYEEIEDADRPSVAYLIWKKPVMTVGGDTFIGEMLRRAGFTNVFESEKRYPSIKMDELKARSPDFLFLSSEPYSFQKSDKREFSAAVPLDRIRIVRGDMFSWYGSRLKLAFPYFDELRARL